MSKQRTDRSLPTRFEQAWQQRFKNFARTGTDDASIAGWTRSGLAVRVRNFSRHWSASNPPGRWLDAGCGAGTYMRLLLQDGAEVVGLDYSLPSLIKARAAVTECSFWCTADVHHLPLRPALFDGALCFGVLQAVSDSQSVIAELKRVSRPGGLIWVDALNGDCLPNRLVRVLRWLRRRPMHLRYETAARLAAIMRAQGLIDVETQWIPILPERYQRWQVLLEAPRMRRLLQAWPLLAGWLCHAFAIRARLPTAGGVT
jgi:ubiquinone/menaquinone biosynthesis C-methylase UbiE